MLNLVLAVQAQVGVLSRDLFDSLIQKVWSQITEKALADAAVDQAGKEKAANTRMFYLQERSDASRAIVTKKLTEAEEERVRHEGNRAASSDQLAVRPQIASNSSGPNPVEKPRQDGVGMEAA